MEATQIFGAYESSGVARNSSVIKQEKAVSVEPYEEILTLRSTKGQVVVTCPH